MIIVGDIGNTETKICLVNSNNKIIKRISLIQKKLILHYLKNHLLSLKLKIKNYKMFIL